MPRCAGQKHHATAIAARSCRKHETDGFDALSTLSRAVVAAGVPGPGIVGATTVAGRALGGELAPAVLAPLVAGPSPAVAPLGAHGQHQAGQLQQQQQHRRTRAQCPGGSRAPRIPRSRKRENHDVYASETPSEHLTATVHSHDEPSSPSSNSASYSASTHNPRLALRSWLSGLYTPTLRSFATPPSAFTLEVDENARLWFEDSAIRAFLALVGVLGLWCFWRWGVNGEEFEYIAGVRRRFYGLE